MLKNKRPAAMILCAALMLAILLSGCSRGGDLMVCLVTNGGSVTDRTVNQSAWEGVTAASAEYGFTPKSLGARSSSTADFLSHIESLYGEGYRVFVLPGILFTEALETVQEQYSDCLFIAVDFTPATVASNTVSLTFADEQAAFLAGFAAAVELQDGSFGGIFGMELPSAQHSSWGFQQGVLYANEHYGTNIELDEQNFICAGTYADDQLGQQLAAEMYDRGVTCIYASAGRTGSGVITEARARTAAGETLWCVGDDTDQLMLGVYYGADSAVLTSATKDIAGAVQDVISLIVDDAFPGGQTLVYDISTDSVGIPLPEEPEDGEEPDGNLSTATLAAVQDVYALLQSGDITVDTSGEGLIR